jgi:hypothetical protein
VRGIPCRGQRLDLPHGRWDWLHLRLEPATWIGVETVWLHYDGAVDPEPLLPEVGRASRIPLTRRTDIMALGLPDRPDLTVTGMTLVAPAAEVVEPVFVDLSPAMNNRGIASGPTGSGGGFNIWDNAFPADELPDPGSICVVAGIPFRFPVTTHAADNVRCRGQLVPLPSGRHRWLYVLGAAERRTEDLLQLHGADGRVRSQWLRLSDFWPDTPARFGDLQAFRCTRMLYPRHVQRAMAPTIWQQRVPVTIDEPVAVELPDNPAMHIFAITAVPDPGATDAG